MKFNTFIRFLKNKVIKIDSAGFGFVLMHKSIVPILRKAHSNKSMFMEVADENPDNFIGEDIVFFRRMKEAGIPLYAHTGALVKHMKRFSLDVGYYVFYWKNEEIEATKDYQNFQT